MERNSDNSPPTGSNWVVRQFLLMSVSTWAGCFISLAAILIGLFCVDQAGDTHEVLELIWMPPLLLVNFLIIPNLIASSICAWYFFVGDSSGPRCWGLFALFQSLMAMCSVGYYVHRWPAVWVTWGAWSILCLMGGTALWFVHQWQMNKWAAEIAILQAENATRIAERQRSGEISEHSPD